MDRPKPIWTSASFLLYAGGLTALGAAVGALGYLAGQYGDGAFAAWALLVLVVLSAIALGFKRRERWTAAGVFAFVSVVAWAVFVGALWQWFGWLDAVAEGGAPFAGFSVARLSLELLVLAAVVDAARRFRFPFVWAIGVLVGWLFVTDLVSGGGNWSATVTFLVGIAYLAAGRRDRPSGFWFHLAAGLLVGGALLYWWGDHGWTWWLVAAVSVLYVALARGTGRSSWAVLGALGLLAASTHFAREWAAGTGRSKLELGPGVAVPFRGWVPPLVFAFTGFLLVSLGLAVARRRET